LITAGPTKRTWGNRISQSQLAAASYFPNYYPTVLKYHDYQIVEACLQNAVTHSLHYQTVLSS